MSFFRPSPDFLRRLAAALFGLTLAFAAPALAQTTPVPQPDATVTTPAPQAGEEPAFKTFELTGKPVAVRNGSAEWDDGFRSLTAAFDAIGKEVAKAGLKPAGRPFAVFLETDDRGFRFDAMVPLTARPEGKDQLSADVKISTSPAGKAMKFEHRGAYEDIDSTYEAITAYLDEKGLEARNLFIEEYLNDVRDPEDTALAVDIYVFIK